MVVDFPTPGDPVMPDPQRLAGLRQQILHQLMRALAVVGALALDQGDGAGQRGALAGTDGAGELSDVRGRLGPGRHKSFLNDRWPAVTG